MKNLYRYVTGSLSIDGVKKPEIKKGKLNIKHSNLICG